MIREVSDLEKANKLLAGELVKIKASLDIYKILGLNAVAVNSLRAEKTFLVFAQMFSTDVLLNRLHNVFDQQTDGQSQRCSIHGVFSLAKKHSIRHNGYANDFVTKYGNVSTDDWIFDIRGVISLQQKVMKKTLDQINDFRNQRLGHLESVDIGKFEHIHYDALEKLLNFASDFCSFIHSSFLGVALPSIPDFRKCEYSLIALLKQIGVSEPLRDFSVPNELQSNPEE